MAVQLHSFDRTLNSNIFPSTLIDYSKFCEHDVTCSLDNCATPGNWDRALCFLRFSLDDQQIKTSTVSGCRMYKDSQVTFELTCVLKVIS